MRKWFVFVPVFVLSTLFCGMAFSEEVKNAGFTPFTGKVAGQRVRVRLEADLNGHIVREASQGEYVLVVGENQDFYAVKPPTETKAYVFRTYVLDDVIEGNHVNVRLQPDLDAPVVAQLNTGDPVKGVIHASNSKWLEIAPPENTVFYISKDYVKQAGDANFIVEMSRRQDEVKRLLNNAYLVSQVELRKPYEEIHFETVTASFQEVITKFADFSEQLKQAEDGLALAQDAYLRQKVAFLEQKNAELNGVAPEAEKETLLIETPLPQELATLEEQESNENAERWLGLEKKYVEKWLKEHPQGDTQTYYQEAQVDAAVFRGILEPYSRRVGNKPGDYLLRDDNGVPIAYLYSTKVELKNNIGKKVSVLGIPRPNNSFAFPAFFVLSVE